MSPVVKAIALLLAAAHAGEPDLPQRPDPDSIVIGDVPNNMVADPNKRDDAPDRSDLDDLAVGGVAQKWGVPPSPPLAPRCGGSAPAWLPAEDAALLHAQGDDKKHDFLQCVANVELVHHDQWHKPAPGTTPSATANRTRPRGQAAGDFGVDGEESTPAEDRRLIESLLEYPGGDGETLELAEMLMYIDVFPMCHCMHKHLPHEGDVCDERLQRAMQVWKPWCRLLHECQTVGEALLATSYVCKAEGMHEYRGDHAKHAEARERGTARNTSSVLCKDKGANSCAIAMENLFVTTHANLSRIEERAERIEETLGAAYMDSLGDEMATIQAELEGMDEGGAGVGDGGDAEYLDADGNWIGPARLNPFISPPPPHPAPPMHPGHVFGTSRVGKNDFARLSQCMHRAGVNHATLDLPLGLYQISGNGSYTSYADLFYDKCGVVYKWAWVWDDVYYFSGYDWAQAKWREGGAAGKALAIAILCLDALLLLCMLFWLYRCVKRGCCFWLCLRADAAETSGLTAGVRQGGSDDPKLAAEAAAGFGDNDGMEMGELPDKGGGAGPSGEIEEEEPAAMDMRV